MIGAKRKAESSLGTDDIVQQALRAKEAEKEAKRRLKDPSGTVHRCTYINTYMKTKQLQRLPVCTHEATR